MTRIILIIPFFLFVGLTFLYTVKNNNSYMLTINKDRVEKQNKNGFWVVPTTLSNNSNDTLKYFSMSCSWQNFYSVDNKKLQIEIAECDKNIPTILVIPPRQSMTVKIRLLNAQTMNTSGIKFKIGLNLIKVTNNQKIFDFNLKEERKKKNVIWSNIITL